MGKSDFRYFNRKNCTNFGRNKWLSRLGKFYAKKLLIYFNVIVVLPISAPAQYISQIYFPEGIEPTTS